MPPDSPSQSSQHWNRVGTFSDGIARTQNIAGLLRADEVVLRPRSADAGSLDAIVGWGAKSNTAPARDFARAHGLPYWRVEDGFLRSIGLGVEGAPPLSIVLDDAGIYYDARAPSRLERILTGEVAGLDSAPLVDRARAAMRRVVRERLSKYNNAPSTGPVLYGKKKRVLIVDQTAGDLSIAHGLADADTFPRMLHTAREEHPDAELVVKVHPDVLAGKKRGHLVEPGAELGARVVAAPCTPMRLLEQVDAVYVVSSQMGFEALLAGLPVVCFGAPFYAGWGLTEDRVPLPRRSARRSVEEVFAAAFMLYAQYVDPDTGAPCEIERVVEHLALQRRMFERNRGTYFCFGFPIWKRHFARTFLQGPESELHFPRTARDARLRGMSPTANLVVWGQRKRDAVEALRREFGARVLRMEDGFLRSVGLGSDLTVPASLVLDSRGLYYDPQHPSDLEHTLETTEFSPQEKEAAGAFRRRLLKSGLSKYNLGQRAPDLGWKREGRTVALVPGQVEDDASIELGTIDVRSNLQLLEEARRHSPEAFIVFKPHPDVLSGNRSGAVPDSKARELCDHIEEEASIADCLAAATEVHTMTSLVGFEALLRELEVHVYGIPFYAGWGLTHDRHSCPRRTRRLDLDELVAGTYLRYPRYINRRTLAFTTADVVLDQLAEERERSGERLKKPWTLRQLGKLANLARGTGRELARRR